MSGSGSMVASNPARTIGWSSMTRTRITIVLREIRLPRNWGLNLDSGSLSPRSCDLDFGENLRGSLIHILESPVPGFPRSFFGVKALAVVSNRQRNVFCVEYERNIDRARLTMTIRVV